MEWVRPRLRIRGAVRVWGAEGLVRSHVPLPSSMSFMSQNPSELGVVVLSPVEGTLPVSLDRGPGAGQLAHPTKPSPC